MSEEYVGWLDDEWNVVLDHNQPLVRCRDCKRYHPAEGKLLCCRFEIDGFVQWRYAEPDGFCAWSCRRGDAE